MRLLREKYEFSKSFEENLELFVYQPPNLYNYYQERIKNPEALNKLMAFSIVTSHKLDSKKGDEISVDEKLLDAETYNRISEEIQQTPQIERLTEENKKKGYKEILSSTAIKLGKDEREKIKEIEKKSQFVLEKDMKEILTHLGNQKEKGLKGDIETFLSKYEKLYSK